MERPNPYLQPRILDEVRTALSQRRKRRLDSDELRAIVERISPGRRPEARHDLKELCDQLIAESAIDPVTASGLDTSEFPPIAARFHNRLARANTDSIIDEALHPLLPTPPQSWRGTRELALLNTWVAEVVTGRRHVETEPLGRRMLEIFGIEKPRTGITPHLSSFPGWLGPRQDILRLVEYPHPGGAWTRSTGDTVVMVENAETFGVLHQLFLESPPPRARQLVFASGNALARPLDDDFARILYFGDWDLDGIATLLRLADSDRRVTPWLAAYRRLLQFPPAVGYAPRRRRLEEAALRQLLPEAQVQAVVALMVTPRLIPQEWLGLAEMRLLLAQPRGELADPRL